MKKRMSSNWKGHWNQVGDKYQCIWKNMEGVKLIENEEKRFIINNLPMIKKGRVLDVGCGNGRILSYIQKRYDNDSSTIDILGLDFSEKMVEYCELMLKKNKNSNISIRKLDISNQNLKIKVDAITAIRVLKYMPNWKEVIQKVVKNNLKDDGIFIFTVLNKKSLNGFKRFSLPIHRSSLKEINEFVNIIGCEVIQVRGFSVLPDFVYMISQNKNINLFIRSFDNFLVRTMRLENFSRILFFAIKKNNL